jgi:MoaA/NifB/PqqE/SkfB family radical SAM enzyme
MSILKIKKSILSKFPLLIHPFLEAIFENNSFLTEKFSNFQLNELEMEMKKSYLTSYPYYLVLDPTNICNLRCPLCPSWQDFKARTKGVMSIQTFQEICDEIGPYLFAVNLCNWGEPFLNPDLSQMIRYAKKFNTVVGLSTNANYLPDDTAQDIVESGVDIIILSIDGATQKSYSRYRRGGNLSAVLSNIERLNTYKEKHKNTPLLIWQFLVNKYNESEIDDAREMSQKMGMQFSPTPMRSSMGKELLLPVFERVKEMKGWVAKNPQYNKYAYEINHDTKTSQKTCKWLWNTTVINWDCSISPCCGVFGEKWDFATFGYHQEKKQLKYYQAWNSSHYKLARKLVASYMENSKNLSRVVKEAENKGLICLKCIQYGFLED